MRTVVLKYLYIITNGLVNLCILFIKSVFFHGKLFVFTFFYFLLACQNNATDPSFSILPDEESFRQEAIKVQSKVDFLWVIDNSDSMSTSQNILAKNFGSFISSY